MICLVPSTGAFTGMHALLAPDLTECLEKNYNKPVMSNCLPSPKWLTLSAMAGEALLDNWAAKLSLVRKGLTPAETPLPPLPSCCMAAREHLLGLLNQGGVSAAPLSPKTQCHSATNLLPVQKYQHDTLNILQYIINFKMLNIF